MKESLADQLSQKLGVRKKTSVKEKSAIFPAMSEDRLSKGSVVYLALGESEGLRLCDGYDVRNKFITIIGTLPDGTVVGSLRVNTRANVGNDKLDQCQYPLKTERYAWLDYSSWLDCSRIITIERSKVLSGKYCGALDETDFGLVMQCIRQTDLISNKTKKKFGII